MLHLHLTTDRDRPPTHCLAELHATLRQSIGIATADCLCLTSVSVHAAAVLALGVLREE